MRVCLIMGQSHKGSTYHIARGLAEKLTDEIEEFFLPRDFGEFCVGCTGCFMVSESRCPHQEKLAPIIRAMDAADVIILASPVYVYHVTGAMKAFLDHLGYRWLVHSPEPSMFTKQAVCISTAAGAGNRSTLKDMADSLFFWGVARIYRLGMSVFSTSWAGVSEKKKAAIDRKTTALARTITRRCGSVKPGLKTRVAFLAMRQAMRSRDLNPRDAEYWRRQGWTEDVRPWRKG